MAVLKIFFYLVVLILVLVLAYYTTRTLGKGINIRPENSNMRVLDRLAVGRDSSLLVVKVQERILLLGLSPAGIQNLGELEAYEKKNPAEAPPDFAALLAGQMKAHIHWEGKHKKNGGDQQ